MEPADNGVFIEPRGSLNLHAKEPSGGIKSSAGDLDNDLPSPLIPPYWLHRRRESYASLADSKPSPIVLEDHEASPEHCSAVWAKAIYIENHVVVSGSLPNVGNFVVWHCKIETIDGGSMVLRKRYSEFYDLQQKLLTTFPNSTGSMPPFPPKSLICKPDKEPLKGIRDVLTMCKDRFRPSFLEKRRVCLGYWLT